MAKLRHLAIATQDPKTTAEFYKKAFGLQEVKFVPERPESLGWGYMLSDGTVNLAILKFVNDDQLSKGLDYVGLHHLGFLVEDIGEASERLKALGARPARPPMKGHHEVKFFTPDGLLFDISQENWVGGAPARDKD